MELGLTGKRFLVTGGTRGIGRAIVEGLLAEGADVAFCARSPEAVAEAQAELSGDGSIAFGTAVDVADQPALADWVATSAESLGSIDGVVANVSALSDDWRSSIDVDLMGTIGLVDAALPHLLATGAGSIVTISSVSGREIDVFAGAYGTMKAAVIHYTQGLAYQLAGRGVRANTVSPGNTYFPGGVWPSIEENDPELFATALGLNPTGRMATPQEVANAVVFVSSSAASFISGTNLLVDGALTRGVQL
ncbi:3-ketoacyl-ACP reductase [Mycobacterium antarcticum]|uniref:SDR family NAD(P)-dependent oxidoreductase n=1 Tax=unclassified Mycolicibacterium TaxID=2636767 RepID=UPI0023A3D8C3|nr:MULTISPECIES: SDR family NAD(P)-dependent oxidoreductase [unclassified Mycolicibacterium]BDX32660.1 3-ketoacyl-ACP reductase [Mycolicibacterium sp. TUM20985]GLP75868.1 3-ketoacyl-ACP reductase [Mycolicibacterium sp. TUM20983]GLP83789.1 3-ketoacyl-ACP reductase [Mycolicibacterium sp. TUM20984]